jgi:hypothetical protein
LLFKGRSLRIRKIGTNGFILAGGHLYGLQDDRVNEGSGGAGGLGTHKDRLLELMVAKVGPDRLESQQTCPVEILPATIADPAKKAQVVAMTGLDRHRSNYGWSSGYSVPFAADNRLFVRTFNTLYCFGDPGQPFMLLRKSEEGR